MRKRKISSACFSTLEREPSNYFPSHTTAQGIWQGSMIIGWAWVQAGDKLMGIFFFFLLLFSFTKIIILRRQDCQAILTQVILTLGPEISDFPIHGLLGCFEPKSWCISYLTSNSPTAYGFTSLLFLFVFHHPNPWQESISQDSWAFAQRTFCILFQVTLQERQYMVKSTGSEFRLPKGSFQPCHSPVVIPGKILNFFKPQFSQL